MTDYLAKTSNGKAAGPNAMQCRSAASKRTPCAVLKLSWCATAQLVGPGMQQPSTTAAKEKTVRFTTRVTDAASGRWHLQAYHYPNIPIGAATCAKETTHRQTLDLPSVGDLRCRPAA